MYKIWRKKTHRQCTYKGGFNASSHPMFVGCRNCFVNVCILFIETSLDNVHMHNKGWILFISGSKLTISWNVRSHRGKNGVQRIANSVLLIAVSVTEAFCDVL